MLHQNRTRATSGISHHPMNETSSCAARNQYAISPHLNNTICDTFCTLNMPTRRVVNIYWENNMNGMRNGSIHIVPSTGQRSRHAKYIDRPILHNTRHLNVLPRWDVTIYLSGNILAATRGQYILTIKYTRHPKRQYIMPPQQVVRLCVKYIGRTTHEKIDRHHSYWSNMYIFIDNSTYRLEGVQILSMVGSYGLAGAIKGVSPDAINAQYTPRQACPTCTYCLLNSYEQRIIHFEDGAFG